jgi:hypothetical protein
VFSNHKGEFNLQAQIYSGCNIQQRVLNSIIYTEFT